MNNSVYSMRRKKLASQLGAGGVAFIPTAPEQQRNRDSSFPFRADSYFFYLTGFEEPNSALVVHSDGTSTLFCPPKDLEREIWDGIRLGPEAAPAALGVHAAYAIDALDERMPDLIAGAQAVWYPFATHQGLERQVDAWLQVVRAKVRSGVHCPNMLRDACELLDEMRLIKDAGEIATMRRAAQISAGAHIRAMQLSAQRLRAGLDTREYHLEAELLHEFRLHGSEFPAYTSIVAAGSNACVLHYRAGNAAVLAGDLVLIDAGCELHNYASDITRTFPAHGKFSSAQRDLYEVVLAAQEAAIAVTKQGARFSDPHDAALRVITQGLIDHKLIDNSKVKNVDDAIEQKAYMPFYMHRTGHWLGLDVHDCGRYATLSKETQKDGKTPLARTLEANMVLTIEPGIYVRPDSGAPAHFHNIGIRIEDDAVVTATGCDLLSRDVPVSVAEIEALMQSC